MLKLHFKLFHFIRAPVEGPIIYVMYMQVNRVKEKRKELLPKTGKKRWNRTSHRMWKAATTTTATLTTTTTKGRRTTTRTITTTSTRTTMSGADQEGKQFGTHKIKARKSTYYPSKAP